MDQQDAHDNHRIASAPVFSLDGNSVACEFLAADAGVSHSRTIHKDFTDCLRIPEAQLRSRS